jgi:S1-C subfamily serine protease
LKRLLLTICFVLSLSLSLASCVKANKTANYPEPDFINHLEQSTVALVTQDMTGEYYTTCSGFWISEVHLVTARHCVDDAKGLAPKGRVIEYTTYQEFSTTFPPKPPKKVYKAVVLASRTRADLAILKTIDDIEHNIFRVATGKVPVGTEVHMMGHPQDMDYSYINGIVSRTRIFDFRAIGSKRRLKILHITSLIHRGSSGGAAVNGQGHVVGIVSSMRNDVPGMTYYIHKDELLSLAKDAKVKHY